MKRQLAIFVAASALLLLLLPAFNLLLPKPAAPGVQPLPWWHRDSLYRVDAVLSWLARRAYPLGISTEPTQVVIGRDGWLFLGDLHNARLSRGRAGATAADNAAAAQIAAAQAAWADWYRVQGVGTYRVLLARDKNTLYPQQLPQWASDVQPSAADALLSRVPAATYIDTRQALIDAKRTSGHPLYYKADSHWNSLGAWVGFKALVSDVAKVDPALDALLAHPMRLMRVNEYRTGDLSVLLRTAPTLPDVDLETELAGMPPVTTRHLDFESGRLLYEGGNLRVGATTQAMLVTSSPALTTRRVLWLRDSFGVAMAPYMAATFSQTLQVHYSAATPERIAHWVRIFKPDHVVITVVERDAMVDWFKTLPPR